MLLAAGTTLSLDLKSTGKYGAGFIASLAVFVVPTDPATGFYTGTLNTNTKAANSIFDTSQPGSIPLMGQISWTLPGTTIPKRSDEWSASLKNSVRRGDEGVPVDAQPPYPAPDAVDTIAARNAAIAEAAVDLSNPGPIGDAIPGAGVFTTLGVGTKTPGAMIEVSNPNGNAGIWITNVVGRFSFVAAGAQLRCGSATSEIMQLGYGGGVHIGDPMGNVAPGLAVDDVIESTNATTGLVLRSSDGTRYRVTVANGGALVVAAV